MENENTNEEKRIKEIGIDTKYKNDSTVNVIQGALNKAAIKTQLTANTGKGEEEACLKAGMNAFLIKPIDRLDLLNTIAKWHEPGRLPPSDSQLHAENHPNQPALPGRGP